MSARSKARKRALDFLYEADIKKVLATDLFTSRGANELSQEPYVLVLINGVAEHLPKIDELIITYAQGWDMDRMPPIDRNILRIAIFEILWAADIDNQVACDEAVELAKSLSTDESSSYINNDAIAKSGKMLAKIYGETDLLIAESIQSGVFNNLSPADLVSVISSCIYESRNEEAAKVPRGDIQIALAAISKIYAKIHDAESDLNLEPMRAPDFGFCWASHKWASGQSLTSILKGTDLTVGDFVRSMKQIIDCVHNFYFNLIRLDNKKSGI